MANITKLSPTMALVDKDGKPMPELVRKLNEIIDAVNALKTAVGL